MASAVEIVNFGLNMVGASRIANLADASKAARAVAACYDTLRQAELRKHVWSFAIARAEVSAISPAPPFGPTAHFQLPVDFLRLAPRDWYALSAQRDWVIEGRTIVTNYSEPFELRYVRDEEVANVMDPLFRITLSARIGWHVCEELTGSSTKRQICNDEYDKAIAEARRINGIEKPPQEPTLDDWTAVRGGGGQDHSRGWA